VTLLCSRCSHTDSVVGYAGSRYPKRVASLLALVSQAHRPDPTLAHSCPLKLWPKKQPELPTVSYNDEGDLLDSGSERHVQVAQIYITHTQRHETSSRSSNQPIKKCPHNDLPEQCRPHTLQHVFFRIAEIFARPRIKVR